MNQRTGKGWDHKTTVRGAPICAGHLSEAVFNALQRVVWEHHEAEEYWAAALGALRTFVEEAISDATEHQGEWTQFLQEALTSACERCRSDNPNGVPGYKRRWQDEADAKYDRRVRQVAERDERDEANRRARDRRHEDGDRGGI